MFSYFGLQKNYDTSKFFHIDQFSAPHPKFSLGISFPHFFLTLEYFLQNMSPVLLFLHQWLLSKGKQTEKKTLWLQASALPKKEENLNYIEQQAGAELGQAQLKLGLDFT